MAKIKVELGEVQKTLLIPLWGRAVEYDKPHPILRDPYALELASRIDFDFQAGFQGMAQQFLVNCAVRAHHFDTALKALIAEHPDATIVNIGAGLDTTFPRVDNGRITWYDLDLPDAMALRRQLIPESDRNPFIAKSVFDRTWFQDIRKRGSKIFLMAGGVFAYLPRHDIKPLFLDISKALSGCDIMFEIYTPFLVFYRNLFLRRWGKGQGKIARFQWGEKNAKAIAAWSPNFHVLDEFPFYARTDLSGITDPKILQQMKTINSKQWIKMVRLRLG